MGLYEDLCIANDNIEIKETSRLPNFQPGCYMNGEIFIKNNLPDTRKAKYYTKNWVIMQKLMGIY